MAQGDYSRLLFTVSSAAHTPESSLDADLRTLASVPAGRSPSHLL